MKYGQTYGQKYGQNCGTVPTFWDPEDLPLIQSVWFIAMILMINYSFHGGTQFYVYIYVYTYLYVFYCIIESNIPK